MTGGGGAGLCGARGLQVLLRQLGFVDRLGEPGGLGLAAIALGVPLRLLLSLMLGVIGLPGLVGGLIGGPLTPLFLDPRAAGAPVGLGPRFALLLLRARQDRLGPGQEPAGEF